MKCSNCGLIYSNPQPIPIDFNDHYAIDVESYWTDDYLNEETNITCTIDRLKSYLDFNNTIKALDIGAGFGQLMRALDNRGFKVYGIEPSKPFYDYALEKNNIPKEALEHISMEDAAFNPETFDFIVFSAVLEHFENPSSALEKAIKWLKPVDLLKVKFPNQIG